MSWSSINKMRRTRRQPTYPNPFHHITGVENVRFVGCNCCFSPLHAHKQATSGKDEWMLALIARGGTGKAAVALANKNVRTAWAMLTQGTEYNCKPCLANAA